MFDFSPVAEFDYCRQNHLFGLILECREPIYKR